MAFIEDGFFTRLFLGPIGYHYSKPADDRHSLMYDIGQSMLLTTIPTGLGYAFFGGYSSQKEPEPVIRSTPQPIKSEPVKGPVGEFEKRIAKYDPQDREAFKDARAAVYILLGGYAKDNPAEIERFLNDKIKDESIRNMTIKCIHRRKIKTIENQSEREKARDQIMDDVLKTFDEFYGLSLNGKDRAGTGLRATLASREVRKPDSAVIANRIQQGRA